MVEGWINIVGSDSVDAKGLHKGSITQAERAVAQRVGALSKRFGASRLVSVLRSVSFALCVRGTCNERYPNDLKPIVCYIVDKVGSLDLDILDGRNERNGGS